MATDAHITNIINQLCEHASNINATSTRVARDCRELATLLEVLAYLRSAERNVHRYLECSLSRANEILVGVPLELGPGEPPVPLPTPLPLRRSMREDTLMRHLLDHPWNQEGLFGFDDVVEFPRHGLTGFRLMIRGELHYFVVRVTHSVAEQVFVREVYVHMLQL